ncbi:JAB domain-containing protein [Desulfosporosinus nitroreducens]|uniref:DNA repair protein n=1 Tax=Desulfosporosinus nitroreducens TaxID=2018668 RepID=A0ABT8QRS7_9FIRM|nr:JAB domain-containing protein [Desulfosporosinus nitroreducens]MDO0824053.1 DNA repair protein [Desulfosporosinus nitroreducens]
MNAINDQYLAELFLNGLAGLTGLSYAQLKEYAKSNSIFNIIDYPDLVHPNPDQLAKIELLKELIKTYNVLRTIEDSRLVLNTPSAAGRYFISFLEGKRDKEVFMVTFLDTKLQVIETRVMSEGNINSATVYPKDVLKRALDCKCSSIFLAHNHPSGDPTPSQEDIVMTQRLVDIFEPLEIGVNDHFIVGGMRYYSLREHGKSCFSSRNIANYEAISYHNNPFADEPELEL